MTPGLNIAPGLAPLPLDAVTSTFGILAKKGAGKTHTASVIAEEMIGAGLRICILDPVGAWWGLRSSADGERPGLPVVVFGGERADVELHEGMGAQLADLVVDGAFSCVIDLSLFETKASMIRFALAFAKRIYHRNRAPLHLFVDEADMFAPQRPMGEDAALLGAMENIVRRGRQRGLGVTMITQRAAVLNKNVLSQIDTLLVLRTTSPQDRDAIDEWIEAQASKDDRKKVIDTLPSLNTGEAWVWSPSMLGVLARVQIRRRSTFDSSATPKIGEVRIEPKALAPVDIAAIRKALTPPKEAEPAAAPPSAFETVAAHGHHDEAIRLLEGRVVELEATIVEMREALRVANASLGDLRALHEQMGTAIASTVVPLSEALDGGTSSQPAQPPSAPRAPFGSEEWAREHLATCNDAPCMACGRARQKLGLRAGVSSHDVEVPIGRADESVSTGAKRMLTALAMFHPKPLTRAQLATLAQFSPHGGGFRNVLSELATHEPALIAKDGDNVSLTAAGAKAAGPVRRPTTTAELVATWNAKLGTGARRMLAVLAGRYPGTATRQILAAEAGFDVDGGGFRNCLSELSTNGLITKSGKDVKASSALFLGGRR